MWWESNNKIGFPQCFNSHISRNNTVSNFKSLISQKYSKARIAHSVKWFKRLNSKSLGPICFVKFRPPDFSCNKFLLKMYRLLQNYTFEICTLSKIMNICCKYKIFTGRSLFTSDRKVDMWFRTHVRWFAIVVLTRFSFSSLIYMNINMFLKV